MGRVVLYGALVLGNIARGQRCRESDANFSCTRSHSHGSEGLQMSNLQAGLCVASNRRRHIRRMHSEFS